MYPQVRHQTLRPCIACTRAKTVNTKVTTKTEAPPVPVLDTFSSDLKAMHCPSRQGFRYIATVIDKASKYTYLLLLRRKSDFADLYAELLRMIRHQKGTVWKKMQTDGGGEYNNKDVRKINSTYGIIHTMNAPCKSAMNGDAERFNRTLIEAVNAMLVSSGLHAHHWQDAATHFVYLKNRTYHRNTSSGTTPYEAWEGRKPLDVAKTMPPFGCLVSAYINGKRKCDLRTRNCIFLGIGEKRATYRLQNLETKKVTDQFIPNVVRIFENHYPLKDVSDKIDALEAPSLDEPPFYLRSDSISPGNQSVLSPANQEESPEGLGIHVDSPNSFSTPQIRSKPSLYENTTPYEDDERSSDTDCDDTELPVDAICDQLIRNMVLTAEVASKLPTAAAIRIPKTIEEAKTLPEWPFWKEAIQKELEALEKQNTWKQVGTNPQGTKPLTCRWVFKLKPATNIEPARFKARLVAHGYKQTKGVDFNETYAAVARMASFRTLVSIAAAHNLDMTQIDIGNAFLHGQLQEDVYMRPPPGFSYLGTLKLQKALYGLKQAPRLWYQHLTNEFRKLGFKPLVSDPCILKHHTSKFYVLLYVDDIILATGPDNKALRQQVELKLSEVFEMKNFGVLRSFLGVEVAYHKDHIKLTQTDYIKRILAHFGMSTCKAADTPAVSREANTNPQESGSAGNVPYRELVGALLYLSATRPDISAAVSELSRHVENPTQADWNSGKRVLRYLSGTTHKGITFGLGATSSNETNLFAFSDSDWASCKQTRRSRTGFVVYNDAGPISWKSQLQTTTALSTCEAEYLALVETIKELLWVKQLLTEMNITVQQPIKVFVDNQAAMLLAANPSHHSRTKHIDIRHHFIREYVSAGTIELYYIDTKENVSDLLTKATSKSVFQHLIGKLVC